MCTLLISNICVFLSNVVASVANTINNSVITLHTMTTAYDVIL